MIVRLEEQSDTTFSVAVFDESGVYEESLLAHDGLVRFRMCESADEVERLVLRESPDGWIEISRDTCYNAVYRMLKNADKKKR